MNTQPEALRLAKWLDLGSDPYDKASAIELRRLHEVNQELVEVLMEASKDAESADRTSVPDYMDLEWVEKARALLAKIRRTE